MLIGLIFNISIFGQNSKSVREFSGFVVTQQIESVPNVSVEVQISDGKLTTVSGADGILSIKVPREPSSVKFSGNNTFLVKRIYSRSDEI